MNTYVPGLQVHREVRSRCGSDVLDLVDDRQPGAVRVRDVVDHRKRGGVDAGGHLEYLELVDGGAGVV